MYWRGESVVMIKGTRPKTALKPSADAHSRARTKRFAAADRIPPNRPKAALRAPRRPRAPARGGENIDILVGILVRELEAAIRIVDRRIRAEMAA